MDVTRRAVFLDLDGTLLADDGTFPKTAMKAIARARDRGHFLCLATGRSLVDVPDEIRALDWNGVIAASGGHVILEDGTLLARRTIDPETADEAIGLLRAHAVPHYIEAEAGAFRGPGAVAALRELLAEAGMPGCAACIAGAHVARMSPLDGALPTAIDKITFIEAGAAAEEIRRTLTGKLTIAPASLADLGPDSGELTPLGIDKGWAVRLVLQTIGVPASAAVAIGDSTNDISMFRSVGVSIAMRDAPEAVRTQATHLTSAPHEDGVANALVRLESAATDGGVASRDPEPPSETSVRR